MILPTTCNATPSSWLLSRRIPSASTVTPLLPAGPWTRGTQHAQEAAIVHNSMGALLCFWRKHSLLRNHDPHTYRAQWEKEEQNPPLGHYKWVYLFFLLFFFFLLIILLFTYCSHSYGNIFFFSPLGNIVSNKGLWFNAYDPPWRIVS